MDVRNLIDLRRAHELGRIERYEFRKRFAEVSDNLDVVRASLEGSQIKSIEMTADGIVLGLHSGVRLEWQPKDIGSAATVAIYHGAYELQETELLSALAEGQQVVVDVGANIGWYAVHLAKRLKGPSPRVYAFEPVRRNFDGLLRNIELNGLGQTVFPFNLAVGDRIGEVSFYVPTELPGAAALAELHPSLEQERHSSQITTLDVTLEELRAPKIDLIKCDVEGAELSVLKGGFRRIAHDRPILMLELLRKWSRVFGYHPNDVFKLLADMDYRACAVGRGAPRWLDEVTEETLETNFIFLAPSHQREREILARFGCSGSST